MKGQVLSIEQMRHLKELGVDTSNASAIVYKISETETYCGYAREVVLVEGFVEDYIDKVETFTLQDIIELLPEYIPVNDEQSYDSEAELFINKRSCRYVYRSCEGYPLYVGSEGRGDNVIESAYDLLCWCDDNGYLKGGEK